MYERSAIVLERYFEKIFGLTKENNLKTNYKNYEQIIKVLKEYKKTSHEEEEVMEKFDEIATEIEDIQKSQTKIHKQNLEIENQRNKLFADLGENPSILDTMLQKLETTTQKNVDELKELRIRYVKAMVLFTERQKERNKYARIRRTVEAEFRNQIMNSNKIFNAVSRNDIKNIQEFIETEEYTIEKQVLDLMIKNGKSERVPFSNNALERAVKQRIEIAKKEAQIYMNIYSKTKKILNEIENDNVNTQKPEKIIKDSSVKLSFLEAEKEYIVMFLDNERMTSINGPTTHEKLMEEACKNFDEDMIQIDNLYELILKETLNKSTNKLYDELYNKQYLKQIEIKEKDFQKEATSVKVNLGTVINSNYWRIEGIKNIYKVFQEEVSEKFGKDLSEIKLEEIEDYVEENNELQEEKITNNYDNLSNLNKDRDNDIDSIISKYDNYDEDEVELNDEEYKHYNKYDEYDEEDEYDEYDYEDDDHEKDVDENDYEDEEDNDYDEDDDYEEEEDEDDDYYSEDDDEDDDEQEDEHFFNHRFESNSLDKKMEIDNDDYEYEDDVNNEDLTEEEIDEIIRRSRKRRHSIRNRNREKDNQKGLFRKIF